MSIQESAYRPQLDGVRAFCILFTVCNHAPGMPSWINGSVGVDVFFALSGWLITWLLMSERQSTGGVDLRAFYIRRVFRIVPLYLLAVGLYCAASILMLALRNPQDWAQFKSALPYLLTFNSEYRSAAAGDIFGHAWTLGIEEKFYIAWPAAVFLAGRRVWPAFVVAVVVSLVLIWISGGSAYTLRGYIGLGFGAALAVAASRNLELMRVLSAPMIGVVALAAMVVAYVGSIFIPQAYAWNLLISFSSAFFIAALWFNGNTHLARALSLKPLEFAGKLTYGMYLLHVLSFNAVSLAFNKMVGSAYPHFFVLVIGYLLTLAGAYLLHLLVERPLIGMGRRIAKARSGASTKLASQPS